MDAVRFALSISDQVTAVYIEFDPLHDYHAVYKEWMGWFPDVQFVVVPSPDRSIVDPLINFLDKTDLEANDGQQAVLVLPEIIPENAINDVLHNQTAKLIKNALLHRKRTMGFQRIIIDVPYHLKAAKK
jgi:hypothetical protein